MKSKSILITLVLGLAWMAAVAAGLSFSLEYDTKPGPVGQTPRHWPKVNFEPAADRPTLVMVAHPRCPCTRASIGELAQIMARVQGRVAAYVLFVRPSQAGAAWNDSALQRSAATIPGVTVLPDVDGVAAGRFGAETSGQTSLFAPDGQLLFEGGITASRGHAGDNPGEEAIVSLVGEHTPRLSQSFVFGCALAERNRTSQPVKELK